MPNNLFRDIPTLMELNPRHNINFFESSNTSYRVDYMGTITGLTDPILATNGRIYAIARGSLPYIIEIDPIKNTYTSFDLPDSNRYTAGVLAQNGNIYAFPSNGSQILELNPIAQTTSTFGSIASVYTRGVLAPNGNIYGIPSGSISTPVPILELNPITKTTSTFGSITSDYRGGVLAPNGNIYCIPAAAGGAAPVVEINPITKTTSTFGSIAGNYGGGVLAPNGNIYCIPYGPQNIMVIDPIARTTSNFGSGAGYYWGGALAPNGKIYCPPSQLSINILEIDPIGGTTFTFGSVNPNSNIGWKGPVLAPNGKIYALGDSASSTLIISTGCAHKPSLSLLGPYINNS